MKIGTGDPAPCAERALPEPRQPSSEPPLAPQPAASAWGGNRPRPRHEIERQEAQLLAEGGFARQGTDRVLRRDRSRPRGASTISDRRCGARDRSREAATDAELTRRTAPPPPRGRHQTTCGSHAVMRGLVSTAVQRIRRGTAPRAARVLRHCVTEGGREKPPSRNRSTPCGRGRRSGRCRARAGARAGRLATSTPTSARGVHAMPGLCRSVSGHAELCHQRRGSSRQRA